VNAIRKGTKSKGSFEEIGRSRSAHAREHRAARAASGCCGMPRRWSSRTRPRRRGRREYAQAGSS
jgi:hypothetical protein